MDYEDKIPLEGLYVSRKDPSVRLIITEVTVVDEGEEDHGGEPYFNVTVVAEGEEDDMSAPGYELDPEGWKGLVVEGLLEFVPENKTSLSDIRALLAKSSK